MSIKIAPSILAADFANLQQEVKSVEEAGADWIHVDVMDGHFVPNISFGALVVDAIRPHTKLPLDVHLMIEEPDRYITDFVKSGADLISVHQEACPHLHRTIYHIKDQGVQAGVVLNPATPISSIEPVLSDVDFILLMTVNPGFGGQSFIEQVIPKVGALRSMLDEKGLQHVEIEIDGGINEQTASLVTKQGATILVAGSAIFGQADRKQVISELRR
ncbi:ribulose-5-phosphate 3-epimerase [Seinonella peptonophila]|uniref:Ribulose-phosphate 3-epimerase n=1 Tax=Seinonella peptonophila TaxID=112248 RepID=A0A1M4UV60_9BACL|nr:ribulose-phosphate 3-epimerase [Seinonella peptonophila]SHE60661.1 ribulose-5-phosphate 3-epimerase [Seinonella peptonophila]